MNLKEIVNVVNILLFRLKLLKNGMMRLKSDGLSSLSYRCLKVEERPLYTWISVDLDSFFNDISHFSDNVGRNYFEITFLSVLFVFLFPCRKRQKKCTGKINR